MDLMQIISIVIALIAGALGGFFYSRRMFKKEVEKNPPINEKMIRAMYMQMGRKPSEAQIKQIMNATNKHKK